MVETLPGTFIPSGRESGQTLVQDISEPAQDLQLVHHHVKHFAIHGAYTQTNIVHNHDMHAAIEYANRISGRMLANDISSVCIEFMCIFILEIQDDDC